MRKSRSAGPRHAAVAPPVSSGSPRSTSAIRKGVAAWTTILLLGSLSIRAGAAVNVVIDIDEFHFLHSAWMVGKGYVPYRDFWTNHSPLFIYILKPLVSLYDENLSLFPVARLLSLMVNLGLFGLVAALAARGRGWTAGLFAALLLSVNLAAFMVTLTVRHDSLTLICELLALAILARGIRSGRWRDVLTAGVLLGLALALSPKGLFGLSALVIGAIVHQVSGYPGREHRPPLARCCRDVGLLLAGSLGTFVLVVGSLLPIETWPLMVKRVFVESLLSPERFSPLTVFLERHIRAEPIVWVVMVGAVAVAARRWWAEPARRDPLDTLLLAGGLWFAVTYFFLMSSPYLQSALPWIAIGSILGGRLLAMAEPRAAVSSSKTTATAWAICLIALVTWIGVGSAWTVVQEHKPFRRMNATQMQIIQYILSVTGPQDAVFDDNAAYVFRPQASYYGSLMATIRVRIQRGELEFDLPERCERLACKVVITGSRLASLPQKVHVWIRENYVPSPVFPRVLLHKSLLSEEGSAGSRESKQYLMSH